MNKLSLVIPCFQEECHLKASYEKVKNELEKNDIEYEIIFVDDASTDRTKEIIKEISKRDHRVVSIFHKNNIGRGGTVMDGIKEAKHEYVGFIDIDLEISEIYIRSFVKKLNEGYSLVIANRKYLTKLNRLHRIIISRCYFYIERILLKLHFQDTEAGYKFFNKSKLMPVLDDIKNKGWFWDTEIVARSFFRDLRIAEIPVIFVRRKDKKSTVNIFSDSIDYLKNLISFKNEMKISFFPVLNMIFSYKKNAKGCIYAILKSISFPLIDMEKILPKNGLIYDIGCGEGIFSLILSTTSINRNVVGIDLSIERLKLAKMAAERRKNLSFIQEDVANFHFSNCEGVIASDFLHHVDFTKQEKIIHNISDGLNKNGVLLLKEVDKSEKIRSMLSLFWDRVFYPKDTSYFRTKADWIKLLKKYKFNVVVQKKARWFPGSISLFVCKK